MHKQPRSVFFQEVCAFEPSKFTELKIEAGA